MSKLPEFFPSLKPHSLLVSTANGELGVPHVQGHYRASGGPPTFPARPAIGLMDRPTYSSAGAATRHTRDPLRPLY